jgi:hypothetical protein
MRLLPELSLARPSLKKSYARLLSLIARRRRRRRRQALSLTPNRTVAVANAGFEGGAPRGISDCHPSEGRAENKSNIWIIGIWILCLEVPSLG